MVKLAQIFNSNMPDKYGVILPNLEPINKLAFVFLHIKRSIHISQNKQNRG